MKHSLLLLLIVMGCDSRPVVAPTLSNKSPSCDGVPKPYTEWRLVKNADGSTTEWCCIPGTVYNCAR